VDGIHDLGGREGFGPVDVEPDEPAFHADWERRAFGVMVATFMLGVSNGGQFRHSIERMDALHYLSSRYYEHWITGLATRLVETGMVDEAELERRAGGPFPLSRPVLAPAADRGADTDRPRFATGDRVRVVARSHRGHTRLPHYVRGRAGTVMRVDRQYPVPDVEAHTPDGRARREAVYCVRFGGAELWGDDGAEPGATVCVDLWESYLEGAPT
jgi:nitrile hydratase